MRSGICMAALTGLLVFIASTSQAQASPPNLAGTWRVNTPEGPREVIIRPDSSASFGEETIRWRVIGDSIFLAFGEEWVGYTFKLRGNELTVSGGDLEEPMQLKRIGPPVPRPEGVPLPPAPPMKRPAAREAATPPYSR